MEDRATRRLNQEEVSEDAGGQAPQERLTVRAVILGAFVVAFVSVWATYSEFIVRSSRLNMSNFPIALFVPFIGLALVLNPVLRALGTRFALTRSELLVVLIMGLASAVIPAADGLPGYLLGIIAAPYYFATPENGWTQYLHNHIPPWVAPSNSERAMEWFFEGLPAGQEIPWSVWTVPLFWWLSFIGVVAFVSLCIAVMLRGQWAQNERLVYPLATAALDIASEAQGRRSPSGSMWGSLFWIGFSIGFVMIAWNILSYFFPGVPTFPTGQYQSGTRLDLGSGFPGIRIKLNLYTLGFVYLANLDILFSVWFFYLLNILQLGLLNRVGYTLKISDSWGSSYEISGWEGFGALTVFVAWGLWMARSHLRDVFRRAFDRPGGSDDTDELMSYKIAVWGTFLGLIYILLWLYASGMEYRAAALFILGTLITYVGVSKIVAETGLIYVRTPLSGQTFAVYTLGSGALAGSTLTAMSFSYALISYRGLFMPPLVHAARLADYVRGNRRAILFAVIFSLILSTLVSTILTLYLAYGHGAYNFDVWPYNFGNKSAFNSAVNKMKEASRTDWDRLMFFSIGALLMGILSALRYRFPWWPLHPIGLTITGTNFTRDLVFSAFLVWATKGILLKVGGVILYRRWQPFFLGILIGYALAVTLSFGVDMIWFPGDGHVVHVF